MGGCITEADGIGFILGEVLELEDMMDEDICLSGDE